MIVNKAARATREATSPQNGLPEPVPYVYRQQKTRNTYAARIAQRNIDGWWLPPAVSVPKPKPRPTRPPFAA